MKKYINNDIAMDDNRNDTNVVDINKKYDRHENKRYDFADPRIQIGNGKLLGND